MSETNEGPSAAQGWYHCGSCGDVFRGWLGERAPESCAACGALLGGPVSPSIPAGASGDGRAAVQRDLEVRHKRKKRSRKGISARPAEVVASESSGSEGRGEPRRRSGRRVRKRWNLWIPVGLGAAGLALILFLLKHGVSEPDRPESAQNRDEGPALTAEEEALLREALPACRTVWFEYLNATTPEARAQSVKNGVGVVGDMIRFYDQNPALDLSQPPRQIHAAPLKTPEGIAVETAWQTPDAQYEAVFVHEDGRWLLDWKHHVRYSDTPWVLFLAGAGADVGDFRLYVRERRVERAKDGMISLVFYAPRFGKEAETGPSSPEVLVPRNSENGRRLAAALLRAGKERRAFGSQLGVEDPKDLARVRVKLRRVEEDGGRVFRVEEVFAGHWLDLADPGLPELAAPAPAPDA